MSASRLQLALRLAVLAILVGLSAACVSREVSSGAKEAPATVPLSDLAGLTLQVGDQKGGTESLLRAAGALDGLPYKIAYSTFTSGPLRSKQLPRARSTSRSPATRRRSSVRRPTRR